MRLGNEHTWFTNTVPEQAWTRNIVSALDGVVPAAIAAKLNTFGLLFGIVSTCSQLQAQPERLLKTGHRVLVAAVCSTVYCSGGGRQPTKAPAMLFSVMAMDFELTPGGRGVLTITMVKLWVKVRPPWSVTLTWEAHNGTQQQVSVRSAQPRSLRTPCPLPEC
jgi:hypothetical protein